MASNYQYITTSGTIIPDASEILETVQNEFKASLGNDLNLEPSTPQGRLIEAETLARIGVLENNATLANLINPDLSYGLFLDAICALFGVERIAGSSSRVLASVQGTPGAVIPAKSRAKNALGTVWYLENTLTIPPSGTITSYFLSEELGAIPCPVGSLTTIIDAVLGWESITNNLPAEEGNVPESDASLKVRRRQNLFSGASLLQSIKARLNLVPNIRSSFVYENYTSSPVEYQGITIQPHSIYVVADGGTDQDVAQAIFEVKSDGCGYTGDIEIQVKDSSYGIFYPVKFNRPEVINIDVEVIVNVGNNQGSTGDIATAVKEAILSYEAGEIGQVEGLNVGTDVSPFEISAAINIQVPDVFVSSVLISKTGESPTAAVIPININQVASIPEANITVTVNS